MVVQFLGLTEVGVVDCGPTGTVVEGENCVLGGERSGSWVIVQGAAGSEAQAS